MFFKIDALKNVGMFSGKTPVFESLFNKVTNSNTVVFLNIAKFQDQLFIEHLRWLVLTCVGVLAVVIVNNQ